MTDPRHDLTAELLMAELPERRFEDDAYLRWLYEADPFGEGIYESVDDEHGVRVAHYGLVPQEYRDASGPAPFVFSLNAVTRSGTQRRGYFSEIGRRIWGRAAAGGTRVVVGVTNDKSRRPVMRQGWRWIGRLPVLVVPPTGLRARGWERRRATPGWLRTEEAAEWFADLDDAPATGWVNRWTVEHLRWRLAWPGCGPYTVHRSTHLVAVSAAVPVAGVPVAVVLKLLPRAGAPLPLSGHPAVTEACRAHRSPVAVYAGFNRHVHLRGIPAPERVRPAPLNLMVYALDPSIDQDAFELDTFELLDMDGV